MNLAIIVLFGLFAAGVPIAIALGIAPVLAISDRGIPLVILPQIIFESLDSFVLMAIPFFILAGRLMQAGGIAERLINLAVALTGWMHGGLATASVVTSMIFSTMSGSSSATAAAIGTTLIPAMERNKYPRRFAAAIVASSAELGAIIPPSVPMIIYAVVANVSIADLFLGGILPGILIGLSLIAVASAVSWIKNYGVIEHVTFRAWWHKVMSATRDALWSLIMPIIVLGGIYGGFFTPTEAAVVAVIYALCLGLLIYKEMRLQDLPAIFFSAALTSAIVLIIVAFASVFAYALSIYQLPQTLSAAIQSVTSDPIIFLLIVNVLLLILGMFIETLAAIVIIAPILVPIAMAMGIDPIHFGVIIIVNLAIGMVTPPVGVNLFIVSHIANIKIESLIAPLAMFLGILILDLMVISYVPELTIFFIR